MAMILIRHRSGIEVVKLLIIDLVQFKREKEGRASHVLWIETYLTIEFIDYKLAYQQTKTNTFSVSIFTTFS